MKKKLRGLKRTAIQLDYDLYRVRVPIRGVTGARLSVLDLWPEGAGQTLVFVHGYAGVLESWEYQINYFARQHRVIAPDLRGHGQSDAPYSQYTMPELVDDLQAIADDLDLPEKFVLVAHSFGGAIAVEYANAHPERVGKLVLIATAGEYPLPWYANLMLRVPARIIRPLWRYRPRWDAEYHVMKRMMGNNMRHWQGWHMLRNLHMPTLIITGERDNYFPRWVYEDVGKMVPHAEIVDVGYSKHKVQLERHQAVNRAIERFIAGEQHRSWRSFSAGEDPLERRVWISSYEKETPPTVPVPRRPLHSFLESTAFWLPKRKAIRFFNTSLTYKQLEEQVNQFAHVLHGSGVRPGDRVMIVMPNIPQLIVAFYATMKIGGVVVLPSPDRDALDVVDEMSRTNPAVLVTLTSFAMLARQVQRERPVRHVFFATIKDAVTTRTYQALLSRWKVPEEEAAKSAAEAAELGREMTLAMRDAPITPPDVKVDPESLATIIFTSGTTDLPKAVCLSHANLVANTVQTRHWLTEIGYGKEVWLSVVPIMHSYGLTNTMNIPIAVGATMILLPVFDTQDVLRHIREYYVSIFPGVPSMYMALNQAADVRNYGLSSINACISGAASLPVEVQEAFEKLTRGRLVEGYGLTEASPVTHANPLFGVRKPGSIGIPIPNTDARIVDRETGEPLPPGQIGELHVRGPQVMMGYWQPDGTIDTGETVRGGWLHTGDLAVMDAEGYFTVVSRVREAISNDWGDVYPRDVEEVLYENSKVLEAAVVGINGTDGVEQVVAFVVGRPGTDLTAEELLDLCRRRLDPEEIPAAIEFREELPKSFVGKVLRRVLVEELEARRA